MAVQSHKLGPGSLKFGDTGSEVEFAVALRAATIEPEFKEDENLPVLSGEEVAGDATESYKLSGSVLQAYGKDSLLIWAHVHNGRTVKFVFRPDNDKEMHVRGEVVVRRLPIGGKVKERNEADFEWSGLGSYKLTDAEGADLTWTGGTVPEPIVDDTPNWN